MTIWEGAIAERAKELRQAGLTNRMIGLELGKSRKSVAEFFTRTKRRAQFPKGKQRREREDGPRWVQKGEVFPDPLLSRLWIAHPELRPRELINRLLPALYVPREPKQKPKAKPKPKPSPATEPGLTTYNPQGMPTRIEAILGVVSARYNVPKRHLISHRRNVEYVGPRWVAIFMAHEMTGDTMPKIGRAIGERDHTTILHAIRKMKKRHEDDESFRSEIAELKNEALAIECQRPWE